MKTRHQWNTGDDEQLLRVVEECAPLFELYTSGEQNRRYGQGNAWDAVAGRMLPEVRVTGAACSKRWHQLDEERQEREDRAARATVDPEVLDSWQRMAVLIDSYEQSILERLDDRMSVLESHVQAMRIVLDQLAAELGVAPSETREVR